MNSLLDLLSIWYLVPAKLSKDGEQTVALWPRIRRQDESQVIVSDRKPWKVDEIAGRWVRTRWGEDIGPPTGSD